MACSKCGGKKRIVLSSSEKAALPSSLMQMDSAELVTIEYVGPQTQYQSVTSSVDMRFVYRFGGERGSQDRLFHVLKAEESRFSRNINFRVVPNTAGTAVDVKAKETILQAAPQKEEVIVHTGEMSLEVLAIDAATRTILEDSGYATVNKLSSASDVELLSIKHIGESRLRNIKEALRDYAG